MGSFISKPQEPVAVPTAQEPVRENGKPKTSGKRKRSDDDNDEEELRGHLAKKPRLSPDLEAHEQPENIPRQSVEKSGKRKRSEDDEETDAPPTKKPSPDPIEVDREISPVWSDLYPISSTEEDRESSPVRSPLFPYRAVSPPMPDFFGLENPYDDDLYYIPVFEAGLEHNAYQEDVVDWGNADDLYPPIIRTDPERNAAWELNYYGWEEAYDFNDDEDLYFHLDPPVIENNYDGNAALGRGVDGWREAGDVDEAGSQHPDGHSQNENHNDNDSDPESEPSEGTVVADQEEQEMKQAAIRRYAEEVNLIRSLRPLTFDNPQQAAQNEARIERIRTRILAEKEWYEELEAWGFENELCDIVLKARRSSRHIENSYAEIGAACKKERMRPKYAFPRI
ncbi:uncharacterized protein FIESC28_05986 [Fusarium coffeatum]|uniref:Uncharacterized protein n=1 Tax=Fusarium coffeatum TaxID=231269 RepID=A0A366RN19_9HYPO|nr:uncharacterized protein FIESC28_05986 [Fusarium coffeatum]RBR18531.1 hypothetical protein FIESC28_05986 [Fusarium coffeatum]